MKKGWAVAVLAVLALLGVFVTPAAQVKQGGPVSAADTAWILTATALVLLMTPGLSFFYGGMVRLKNVVSTLLQSYMAMAVISLLWVAVGFSLSFGDSFHGLIGDPRTFFMFSGVGGETHPDLAPTIPLMLFALFQMKFAIITPALITGAFAERVRFKAYVIFMVLFSLFIYAPLAHWTWHPEGFLRKWGVLDFAGGTVVHMSAGFAALAGAMVLGRRKAHVDNAAHTPANLPLVLLGTGMLWFGWFGFNAGSALSASSLATQAFATTNTASAAAMLGWMAFDWMRGRKPNAMGACVGAVVGLVAVTPAAGFITVGQSILVGLVASGISNAAAHFKSRTALDDTLDVFPCHGLGGAVGMVLTGVLAKDVGLITGKTETFLMHLLALVIVTGFSFVGSYLLYKLVDLIVPLRVSQYQEEEGLDLSQHGETVGETAVVAAAHEAPGSTRPTASAPEGSVPVPA
ncbi:ammonium transporter [Stigmatella sp. ncwal1]|uniref:Ammonium transporter n=1 Tax=Stigmatella ashevillensis TaxID=2995309 RepID=A0ABT5D0J1_9BACT|nr:ammonium transporter [Stigmatella ashevillena]MDC0707187.1 ammonium transporter [Stigmatella ashevillena]